MFDWTSYFKRLAVEDMREMNKLISKERRAVMQTRSITETIRSCAPLLRRPRSARPRDPKAAS